MCGLYGFVGYKPEKINYTTFLSLGCENDSRGGDGCGIFIDGEIEYCDVKDKYFSNFYEKSELLKSHKTAEILIGHDRKASVGGVTNEKLQPVVLKNEYGDIDFVLMHNGTLYNHVELAKKYLSMEEEESKKYSDSQLLARIIYTHGFGVLGEYIGSAALIIVDYRTPKREPSVFVFKGESKAYKSTKETSEERPLYFIRTKNGLWFSSMCDYFDILTYNTNEDVYIFPTNQVVLINDKTHKGKLMLVEEVDRTKLWQKDYTYNTTSIVATQHPFIYDYRTYNLEDYDWEIQQKSTSNKQPSNQTTINFEKQEDVRRIKRIGRLFVDEKSNVNMHGEVYLYSDGSYKEFHELDYDGKDDFVCALYFYDGYLINGEEALSYLDDCMGVTESVCIEEFISMYPKLFSKLSYTPVYYEYLQKYIDPFVTKNGDEIPLFTGEIPILNVNKKNIGTVTYHIVNGVTQKLTYKNVELFVNEYSKKITLTNKELTNPFFQNLEWIW